VADAFAPAGGPAPTNDAPAPESRASAALGRAIRQRCRRCRSGRRNRIERRRLAGIDPVRDQPGGGAIHPPVSTAPASEARSRSSGTGLCRPAAWPLLIDLARRVVCAPRFRARAVNVGAPVRADQRGQAKRPPSAARQPFSLERTPPHPRLPAIPRNAISWIRPVCRRSGSRRAQPRKGYV